MINEMSRTRAELGFTPYETAMFIFSLKQPVTQQLQSQITDGATLAREISSATTLLDGLGLMTMEAYQKLRDDVIHRQQEEILELSTPVVKVWDGIVAVPLIGTLDSLRTQVVMESLLDGIVNNSASIAIIDITGVPTVDTLVAQHLIKATAAARLMGAECIISGIRPQIAQTMVQLGIDLQDVTTKATLADAIRLAFDTLGIRIERA
jgi:rsbT co-antagonist protein RsbR